jgi:hypothetical protein
MNAEPAWNNLVVQKTEYSSEGWVTRQSVDNTEVINKGADWPEISLEF